jgi:uracil-DNA glycosylase
MNKVNIDDIKIEKSWKEVLSDVFISPNFQTLSDKIHEYYKTNVVYPRPRDIFRAFDLCPFDQVRVVILGQDPYHGAGQANGLSFAVHSDMKIPPSLQNIFKEIRSDLGIEPLLDGDLSRWARQGVLLLNSTLTVFDGRPASHAGLGWEEFTDEVITKLSSQREHLVFILWGNYARAKGAHIDRTKHLVIESPHPSPFSAYNGFFGSKPFSKTNDYLREHGLGEIDWR